MKLSYTIKVPMRERLKILWLGGLHIRINYSGQHEISRMNVDVIHSRDVAPGNILRVDE